VKIAITATGDTLDDQVDGRFGRCSFFIIYDLEADSFEAVANEAQTAGGGAGVQAVQTVQQQGVEVVLTGNAGPRAVAAFQAAEIQFVTGVSGSVRDAVKNYRSGAYKPADGASVDSHYGIGR